MSFFLFAFRQPEAAARKKREENDRQEIRRDPINEGTNSMWNNIILIQEMLGRWVCRSVVVRCSRICQGAGFFHLHFLAGQLASWPAS